MTDYCQEEKGSGREDHGLQELIYCWDGTVMHIAFTLFGLE